MAKMIDACGLACPAPVLLVKDAVEQNPEAELTVVVDNPGSAENVSRFLGTRGYQVQQEEENGRFHIHASGGKDAGAGVAGPAKKAKVGGDDSTEPLKILVLVTSNTFGSGDDVLGEKLMISYLKTIKEMGPELWQLIFVNGGVKLTTASSPVLKEIQEYEKSGVIVLACGTCLDHFGLAGEKKVGGTTNMLDIVMATQLADKVVSMG
jgi:selenium metabolism protein YedF